MVAKTRAEHLDSKSVATRGCGGWQEVRRGEGRDRSVHSPLPWSGTIGRCLSMKTATSIKGPGKAIALSLCFHFLLRK